LALLFKPANMITNKKTAIIFFIALVNLFLNN
jgi:hypothetical protein